jgi:hypothetical protein
MKREWGYLVVAIATLFAMSGSASAVTTVYTSRAAFDAATVNQQIVNFNSLTTAGNATNYNSPVNTLVSGGVTFTTNGPSGTLYVIDTAYGGGAYFFSGGGGPYLNDNNYYTGSNFSTTLTAQLPANTYAVGADFGLQSQGSFSDFTAAIGLSTGENFSFTTLPKSPTFSFLGFVSDQLLTSLTFNAKANGYSQSVNGSGSLDNFTTAQAVPEPAAIMLALGALGVAFGVMRGKRS